MKLQLCALLILSQSSVTTFADTNLPEFLVPVAGTEKVTAEEENEYFLKKQTYFAKRYKIVTVRTDLLINVEKFRVSFFDTVSALNRPEFSGGLLS